MIHADPIHLRDLEKRAEITSRSRGEISTGPRAEILAHTCAPHSHTLASPHWQSEKVIGRPVALSAADMRPYRSVSVSFIGKPHLRRTDEIAPR